MTSLTRFLITVTLSACALTVSGAPPGQDDATSSSIRWKENIQPIEGAISKIRQLRGVFFDWKKGYGGEHDIGFIAEEVGSIVPELAVWEVEGKTANGVKYDRVSALLVEGVKDQQDRIDQQQEFLIKQQEQIEAQELLIADHQAQLTRHADALHEHQLQLNTHDTSITLLEDENRLLKDEVKTLRDEIEAIKAAIAALQASQ